MAGGGMATSPVVGGGFEGLGGTTPVPPVLAGGLWVPMVQALSMVCLSPRVTPLIPYSAVRDLTYAAFRPPPFLSPVSLLRCPPCHPS